MCCVLVYIVFLHAGFFLPVVALEENDVQIQTPNFTEIFPA